VADCVAKVRKRQVTIFSPEGEASRERCTAPSCSPRPKRALAGMPLLTDPVTIDGTVAPEFELKPELEAELEQTAELIRFMTKTTIDG
jgi:hypothetical protein